MCTCVYVSSGQLCAFTPPCCEGGSISGSTQYPLPSRHSFHPTWQNRSMLFLSPHLSLYLCHFFFFYLIDLHFYLHFYSSYSCSLFCFFFFFAFNHHFHSDALCVHSSARQWLIGSRPVPPTTDCIGRWSESGARDRRERHKIGAR